MNNTPPKKPEERNRNKGKYILSIVLGIISIIFTGLGYLHISLFGTSFVLVAASIYFSYKYFTYEKLSFLALFISVTTCLILGYSFIRTIAIETTNWLQYKITESSSNHRIDSFPHEYDDYFEDYFDGFEPERKEPDYWD